MKNIQSINIVCLGNWNKKIFVPEWVASNLFGLAKDSSLEAVFNTSELDIGYKANNVMFIPKESAIEIKPEKLDSETIVLANKVLINLISLLPHTPIKAIGINFRSVFQKSSDHHFAKKIKGFKCELDNFNLSQVKFAEDKGNHSLNIITDIFKDKYSVNFNFHYPIESSPEGFYFDEDDIINKINIVEKVIENE